MVNALIDAAVSRRATTLVLCAAFALVAGLCASRLRIEAFPDVTNIQVQVNTQAPGLASVEVERLITFPVETAMSGLPGVEQVRSVSKTGLSVVTIVFDDGTDTYFARQLVLERLQVEGIFPSPPCTARRVAVIADYSYTAQGLAIEKSEHLVHLNNFWPMYCEHTETCARSMQHVHYVTATNFLAR